jgi:hypothetical protein
MAADSGLPSQALIDGLGQGILIFDASGALLQSNPAARQMLGGDLRMIQQQGWKAASALLGARQSNPDNMPDAARTRAAASGQPERFHAYHAGIYLPCFISVVKTSSGTACTVLTLEQPDWTPITDLFDTFLREVYENSASTRGHADLIIASLKRPKPNETVEGLSKRIGGFAGLIQTHMHRVTRLADMMARMERLRTNNLRGEASAGARALDLRNWLEDFIESLSEEHFLDPETESQDYRSRISLKMPDGLMVQASPAHLSAVLRDLLRNAIMYSMVATPIVLSARETDSGVQLDLADEGYGIRGSEVERVYLPFMRGRQPQIISEFGYGLSVYLCKAEVEAMNGRLWFESEEGVGTTFSIKLPSASRSSSGQNA